MAFSTQFAPAKGNVALDSTCLKFRVQSNNAGGVSHPVEAMRMPRQDCEKLVCFHGVMASTAMRPSEMKCRNLRRVTNLEKREFPTSEGLAALQKR